MFGYLTWPQNASRRVEILVACNERVTLTWTRTNCVGNYYWNLMPIKILWKKWRYFYRFELSLELAGVNCRHIYYIYKEHLQMSKKTFQSNVKTILSTDTFYEWSFWHLFRAPHEIQILDIQTARLHYRSPRLKIKINSHHPDGGH